MNALVCAPVVSLMLISGVVSAEDRSDKTSRVVAAFKALDRDGDQRISQSEANADQRVSARFASLDVNGDGYLSMREYAGSKSPGPMPEATTREPRS